MQGYIYVEPTTEGVDAITRQIAAKLKGDALAFIDPLRGIYIGKQLPDKVTELSGLFDELIFVEIPEDSENNTEVISNVLTDVVKEMGAGILFFGFTHQGMELAPAVGWRLGAPVITGCTGLDLSGEQAKVKRSIMGGKLVVSSLVNLDRGAIISVQKGIWRENTETADLSESVPARYLSWKESWAPKKSRILGISEDISDEEENITNAEILVSVGRGLGDPDNLPTVQKLAEKLGGMISCSRPVVDLRWLPACRQVGISGRTVSPVVYLALGISGQTNHVVGMDASGVIIAVNRDPQAPIFNVADYGVMDDILEFVPELVELIENGV